MITPSSLAKSGTESGHQRAVFCWAAIAIHHGFDVANNFDAIGKAAFIGSPGIGVPELKWLHAIPNGGSRGDTAESRAIRGGQMKAEGVKEGVSDIFLPVRRGQFAGLYIEMKKPGNIRGTSKEQKEFGEFVKSQGFGFIVCDSWQMAVNNIRDYMTHA